MTRSNPAMPAPTPKPQSTSAAASMKAVNAYTEAYSRLFDYFGCPPSYFVQPMTDCPWRITGGEDMHFLSYGSDARHMQNAVIVRQDGRSMVFRNGGYALVVAIDCVKIAFLLDEGREIP